MRLNIPGCYTLDGDLLALCGILAGVLIVALIAEVYVVSRP